MPEQAPTFIIEDAHIIFSNFAGKEGRFNKEGERNFLVRVPDDVARQMEYDGWNVKYLNPREDGDPRTPCINIAVGYKVRPPHIVMITSTARTNLSEDMVDILDWANFETVDLIARGKEWDDNGRKRFKAYLQSLYVTIEENALERKYNINRAE